MAGCVSVPRFLVILLCVLCGCVDCDHEFKPDLLTSAALRANKVIHARNKQFLRENVPEELYSLNSRDIKTRTAIGELFRQEQGNLGAVVGIYNVSDSCFNHTGMVTAGIANGDTWALQFLDAFGKIPPGLLSGNMYFLGSYDECLEIRYDNSSDPDNVFRGQHCTAWIPIQTQQPPSLYGYPSFTVGMCFPSTCSAYDVMAYLNTALSQLPTGNGSLPLFAYVQECHVEGEVFDYDAKAIGAFVLIGVILLMMLIGTTYDVLVFQWGPWSRATLVDYPLTSERNISEKTPLVGDHIPSASYVGEPGIIGRILVAFSVYSNGEKLLSTKQGPGSLTAVNGIRVISMFWVILGHSYVFPQGVANNYGDFLSKMSKRESFQAIMNALVSVDTFFALSGLLLSYLTLREMQKNNGKINWAMFYFHRFWRLTPAYMMVLFVNVSLARYWGDGPLWPKDGFEQNYCEDTWWRNLLYINNMYDFGGMCMSWSWYLANDMQFFVLSPLMLIPLYLSQTIGLAVCIIFLLGTMTATGVITTNEDLPVSGFSPSISDPSKLNAYFEEYYIKPYCRMGPYIVGIMTGYVLYKTEGKFRMNRALNLLCWIIAAVLACLCLYGLYEENKGTADFNTEVRSLYNTLHRSVWGACVCWVIFSCANGYGGFVNQLLSWKAFLPLGRLTYCAYLVHPIVLYCFIYNRRVSLYMDDITMVYIFLATLVAAYSVAFVVSLAFESPMMGLEKVIFKRKQR
ncbi:nose resistant to fluoxetine protein 6-like [Mizuhopecten yessoensis]|uniref:Nose resistant to fluoxetine protein 6 n=1 Tax=Mizuhopecten yessoensis TaxID=6573 RepID=A0A210Q2H6_MIZYE|nr:nose resistant to fluoxetine protein 6-like [Mizuhopecten yessoensis]OWF42953.1 Nose resistant to fluoxetine protein 6 [Mizuhopecten yessoensis]